MGGLLDMASRWLYGDWRHLSDVLEHGGAAEASHYDQTYGDAKNVARFLEGMTGMAIPGVKAIAEKFPWQPYETVVDLGAAEGNLLAQVLKAHPNLLGVGFDLEVVEEPFMKYVRKNGLSERIRFVAGNFF